MAITAVMTAGTSTPNTGQKVGCICTVTNGGSTTVNVTSCVPTEVISGGTKPSGVVLLGQPNIGPGMTTSITASGTLKILFDAVPMAPSVGTYNSNPFPSAGVGGVAITPLPPEAMPQTQAYDIGALVTASDGSSVAATVVTLTTAAVKP